MSKSPNILLPALGGAGIVLGLAYGLASRDYGQDRIEALQGRIAQVEAQSFNAKNAAAVATEKAKTEADRVTALESKIAEVQAVRAQSASEPTPRMNARYGLGRQALSEEIAAWDVDVLPDGRGLPKGSGDVLTGEGVFAEKCAACHGDFAEGVDNWPVLAGGFDTLADKDPVKTVGSYWPHLSTTWDYIYRSMPFGEAGTLSPDETYAIVAYILYSNDLVDDDFELSDENFASVTMHNRDGFIVDDRAEVEYTAWRTDPCMTNCKDEVSVTMRSVFLVETPSEGGTESVMNHAAREKLPSFTVDGPSFIPVSKVEPQKEIVAETEVADEPDALVKSGERVFKRCKTCHEVGPGARNRLGPHLTGIVGRGFGEVDGFKYSAAFKAAKEDGRVWTEEEMTQFLIKPKKHISGTLMNFSGLKKRTDIEAVIAYLKSIEG